MDNRKSHHPNNQKNKAISKYLRFYAEEELQTLERIYPTSSEKHYQHCVCIPAFDEAVDFLFDLFDFLKMQQHTLVILVVNQSEVDSTKETVQAENKNNMACKKWLENHASCVSDLNPLTLYQINSETLKEPSNNDILLVDRSRAGQRIPVDEGVGLARKIAADMALYLYHHELLKTPWFFSTDADVKLPTNYFSVLEDETFNLPTAAAINLQDAAAITLPYQHIPGDDEQINRATALYQQQLNCYVEDLKRAGSNYAYHSLGSILVVNLNHYAAVRGFPKRPAGEDFYLLNKLRKSGPILTPDTPILQIHSRRSDRVPFGTGPAIDKIINSVGENEHRDDQHRGNEIQNDIQNATIFYHPTLFILLAATLKAITGLYFNTDRGDIKRGSRQQPWQNVVKFESVSEVNQLIIITSLNTIGFDKAIEHCNTQSSTQAHFNRHMSNWFDAFRTLKFLHTLREKEPAYNNVSLKQYQTLLEPNTHPAS